MYHAVNTNIKLAFTRQVYANKFQQEANLKKLYKEAKAALAGSSAKRPRPAEACFCHEEA